MSERWALVTGGSRGLGKAIVDTLLDETDLNILSVSRSGAGDQDSDRVQQISCDLTDINALPSFLADRLKGLDLSLCVNNAALGTDSILLTQHVTEIESVVACNLVAPIIIAKHAARAMLKSGGGQIINIASVVAHTGYNGLATYAATKSGLIGFTKSLARELGSANIAVNSISPGFMATDMTAGLQGRLDQIRRRSAVGQLASTQDVADMVLFLATRDNCRHTGHDFIIDAANSI